MSRDILNSRREARARFGSFDDTIENWDGVARSQRGDAVPPIDPAPADVALSGTAEITVSVEWLAFMLDFLAQYDGPLRGVS